MARMSGWMRAVLIAGATLTTAACMSYPSEPRYSTRATPVYGPPRSNAGHAGDGRGEAGAGTGGRGGGAGGAPAIVERLRAAGGYEPAGEAVPLERLPPRYREAVKRYFGE